MIKGYKGFNQDMTCRGFQYKVGKTYKADKAVICEAGFHFCENPLDIFSYYEPSKAVFCEVEGFGETVTHDQDSKVCCTEIKVIASLSIKGFVDAAVKFFSEKKDKGAKRASGNSSMASNSGDRSMASNFGDSSMASNSGYRSMASNSGYRSMASNFGDSGVAVCTGLSSKAMAGKHGCIALAWWNDKDQRVEMVCAEIGCGDGTDGKLKADVWYMVDESRNIVECKE